MDGSMASGAGGRLSIPARSSLPVHARKEILHLTGMAGSALLRRDGGGWPGIVPGAMTRRATVVARTQRRVNASQRDR